MSQATAVLQLKGKGSDVLRKLKSITEAEFEAMKASAISAAAKKGV